MTWHVEALEVISTPHATRYGGLGRSSPTQWRRQQPAGGGWKVEGDVAGGFFGGAHPLFDLEICLMEIGKGFQTHCRNGNENYVYILKTEILVTPCPRVKTFELSPWQGWKSASQATKGQSMYGGLRNLLRFLQHPNLQIIFTQPKYPWTATVLR